MVKDHGSFLDPSVNDQALNPELFAVLGTQTEDRSSIDLVAAPSLTPHVDLYDTMTGARRAPRMVDEAKGDPLTAETIKMLMLKLLQATETLRGYHKEHQAAQANGCTCELCKKAERAFRSTEMKP
jgi:hypothetical protein